MRPSNIYILSAIATLAQAKTDLSGCSSTDVSSPAGASIAWYVPGTGELCEFLDCGGGRAPPKTTVPGCPQYSGTETYSPSYLAGFGAQATTTAPATEVTTPSATDVVTNCFTECDTVSTTINWSELETDTAMSSWDLYTTSASDTAVTTSPTVMGSEMIITATPSTEVTSATETAASTVVESSSSTPAVSSAVASAVSSSSSAATAASAITATSVQTASSSAAAPSALAGVYRSSAKLLIGLGAALAVA
ncbi:hypothetical protein B0A48_03529 [Cryoendolithus antarcticus]|uniref:Ig-like domain-containing protein n=1 Tax=Cryoendolithus antarcticus TaxID=1507870 RepID=A0A1V8TKQ3_9PEZI|nr:hypothetical protein B0A48_03529 [Cryoendolithus antarcticus]